MQMYPGFPGHNPAAFPGAFNFSQANLAAAAAAGGTGPAAAPGSGQLKRKAKRGVTDDIIPGTLPKRRVRPKTSGCSSQYRGVSWHKRDRRWIARAWIKGKIRHLGSYLSEKRAAVAIDEELLKLYGPDSALQLNFPAASDRARILAGYDLDCRKGPEDRAASPAGPPAQGRVAAGGDNDDADDNDADDNDDADDDQAQAGNADAAADAVAAAKKATKPAAASASSEPVGETGGAAPASSGSGAESAPDSSNKSAAQDEPRRAQQEREAVAASR